MGVHEGAVGEGYLRAGLICGVRIGHTARKYTAGQKLGRGDGAGLWQAGLVGLMACAGVGLGLMGRKGKNGLMGLGLNFGSWAQQKIK